MAPGHAPRDEGAIHAELMQKGNNSCSRVACGLHRFTHGGGACRGGLQVTLYDNFSNSSRSVIQILQTITGSEAQLVEGDVRDTAHLNGRCASMTSSGDSFRRVEGGRRIGRKAVEYFDNNVVGTVSLLKAMHSAGIKKSRIQQQRYCVRPTTLSAHRRGTPYVGNQPLWTNQAAHRGILADLRALGSDAAHPVSAVLQSGGGT
jgi:hypothetical protein